MPHRAIRIRSLVLRHKHPRIPCFTPAQVRMHDEGVSSITSPEPPMTQARQTDYPIDPLFTQRWSPRAFTGEQIPEESLLALLEAARWAPPRASPTHGIPSTPAPRGPAWPSRPPCRAGTPTASAASTPTACARASAFPTTTRSRQSSRWASSATRPACPKPCRRGKHPTPAARWPSWWPTAISTSRRKSGNARPASPFGCRTGTSLNQTKRACQ